jgi:hypothetical protein
MLYWTADLAYEHVAFDDIGHITARGHAFVAEVLRGEVPPPTERRPGPPTRAAAVRATGWGPPPATTR